MQLHKCGVHCILRETFGLKMLSRGKKRFFSPTSIKPVVAPLVFLDLHQQNYWHKSAWTMKTDQAWKGFSGCTCCQTSLPIPSVPFFPPPLLACSVYHVPCSLPALLPHLGLHTETNVHLETLAHRIILLLLMAMAQPMHSNVSCFMIAGTLFLASYSMTPIGLESIGSNLFSHSERCFEANLLSVLICAFMCTNCIRMHNTSRTDTPKREC